MKARLIAATFLVIGCSSALAPVAGNVYVLQSISGVAVPAPYAPNQDYTARILADTIVFEAGLTGERRTVLEGDPIRSETRVEQTAFSYTLDGSHIEITFPCPNLALCVAPPHLIGTLSNTRLTITESRISLQPLVFRRLSLPE